MGRLNIRLCCLALIDSVLIHDGAIMTDPKEDLKKHEKRLEDLKVDMQTRFGAEALDLALSIAATQSEIDIIVDVIYGN